LRQRKLIKLKNSANQFDTIKHMRRITHESAKDPLFIQLTNNRTVKNGDIKNLYNCLYRFLSFERDHPKRQFIKSAYRTLSDRNGNCVDYSVLIGAFLIRMGVPFYFRMISQDGSDNFSHVYVVLQDGTPFDLVLGKEFKEMQGRLGLQLPFYNKYDLKVN
jgi:hypothetical protein